MDTDLATEIPKTSSWDLTFGWIGHVLLSVEAGFPDTSFLPIVGPTSYTQVIESGFNGTDISLKFYLKPFQKPCPIKPDRIIEGLSLWVEADTLIDNQNLSLSLIVDVTLCRWGKLLTHMVKQCFNLKLNSAKQQGGTRVIDEFAVLSSYHREKKFLVTLKYGHLPLQICTKISMDVVHSSPNASTAISRPKSITPLKILKYLKVISGPKESIREKGL